MISLSKFVNENKDPCWKGYKQYGTKKKNGKEVPNCVPTNEQKTLTKFINFIGLKDRFQ